MKNVVDLIREYGALSDTRVRRGGTLAPSDEARWAELNAFYDHLMTESGLHFDEEIPFSSSELRDAVEERDRLRVPCGGHAILQHEAGCLTASIVNLSRGGVFLAASTLFPVGIVTTVFLADIPGSTEGEVLELEGEVTWVASSGVPEAGLPRGMGLRFLNVSDGLRERLDSLVLGILEQRLAHLW